LQPAAKAGQGRRYRFAKIIGPLWKIQNLQDYCTRGKGCTVAVFVGLDKPRPRLGCFRHRAALVRAAARPGCRGEFSWLYAVRRRWQYSSQMSPSSPLAIRPSGCGRKSLLRYL
jgi:hypothetical protein